MTIKATGAEFKRFYNDDKVWPADGGDIWHEDEVLTVNGIVQESGIDCDQIPDDAQVTIAEGIVFGPQWDGNEPSFETYFKRWRKSQNTASLVVECDIAVLEAVKTAIKAAGGKVIS